MTRTECRRRWLGDDPSGARGVVNDGVAVSLADATTRERLWGAVVRQAQSRGGGRSIPSLRGRAGAADRGDAAQDAVINTRAARGAPLVAERVRRCWLYGLASRQTRYAAIGRGAAVPLNLTLGLVGRCRPASCSAPSWCSLPRFPAALPPRVVLSRAPPLSTRLGDQMQRGDAKHYRGLAAHFRSLADVEPLPGLRRHLRQLAAQHDQVAEDLDEVQLEEPDAA
jgi:hypothetical protein